MCAVKVSWSVEFHAEEGWVGFRLELLPAQGDRRGDLSSSLLRIQGEVGDGAFAHTREHLPPNRPGVDGVERRLQFRSAGREGPVCCEDGQVVRVQRHFDVCQALVYVVHVDEPQQWRQHRPLWEALLEEFPARCCGAPPDPRAPVAQESLNPGDHVGEHLEACELGQKCGPPYAVVGALEVQEGVDGRLRSREILQQVLRRLQVSSGIAAACTLVRRTWRRR